MSYVDVVVDNNTDATDEFYTYRTDGLDVGPGCKVYVPFGRSNKKMAAYVVAFYDQPPEGVSRIKRIASVDPDVRLSEEQLETALWMRGRTLCRYIEAIRLFVSDTELPQRRTKDPLADLESRASVPEQLTGEQRAAFAEISDALQRREHRIFLLFGVTGSGKTELYLQAMQNVLDAGRGGIVMVPEIALTPQAIQRFTDRFGKEKVAIIHSRLTKKQRAVEHEKIRSGSAPLVIGARSAVFAPLSDIGLIVIDESHETSYKSDMAPKYDTLEVAAKRGMAHGAVVISGSATPSLVDYYRSERGVFTRLELKERYNETPLPSVRIADMRQELRQGNRSLFSQLLAEEMDRALTSGRQIILFLNRRGYSSFVACRECGHVIRCDECGISMPYHKDKAACICHYCGRRETNPAHCPVCGGKTMRSHGAGTQQVEEKVKELFPDARVGRLDLDSVRKRGAMEAILSGFERHDIDILIGTQLVAKGLDVANVGLVGIISADVTLNIPDFRSAERTFQLVTQAAGRSGRGEETGRVVIQTYTPDHEAILCASRHDYEAFYRGEIRLREQIQYPPFADLFLLVLSDEDEEQAEQAARHCADWLRKRGEGLAVMGPGKAPLAKSEGAHRYHIIIKSYGGRRRATSELLLEMKKMYARSGRFKSLLTMDVNPYSFL